MSTATKKKPPKSPKSKPVAPTADEQAGSLDGETALPPTFDSVMVNVDEIVVGENDRTEFDEASIAELAETISRQGLMQPLVVRIVDDAFHLVAGERRLRAIKLLGWQTVVARLGRMSDEQAAEARLVENLQRKDLSAIEEAHAFARLIDRFKSTQKALAKKIGVSQPHVANRLRLLKLPGVWLQRVISGEIPSTHARSLLAYAEVPLVLDKLDSIFFGKEKREIGSGDWWAETVTNVAKNVCRKLDGKHFSSRLGRQIAFFEPHTVPDYQRYLGVIEIEGEDYATNVELWDSRQLAYEDRLVEEQDAQLEQQADEQATEAPAAEGGIVEDHKAKKKRDAELAKMKSADEQEAAEKAAEALVLRVAGWRLDWLSWELARHIRDNAEFGMRVVLMLMQQSGAITAGRVSEMIEDDASCAGAGSLNEMLARCERPVEVLLAIAEEALWQGDQPCYVLDGPQIEALAEAAGIDLAAAWHDHFHEYPLTEAFFQTHNRQQLHDLGCELWGWSSLPDFPKSKADAVAKFMDSDERALTRAKLPSIILPVAQIKAPKAKRGAAKKESAKPAKKAPAAKAAPKKRAAAD